MSRLLVETTALKELLWLNIIFEAAESEVIVDPEVQKLALAFEPSRKLHMCTNLSTQWNHRQNWGVSKRPWKLTRETSFCCNFMTVKTPRKDPDCIREMACFLLVWLSSTGDIFCDGSKARPNLSAVFAATATDDRRSQAKTIVCLLSSDRQWYNIREHVRKFQ